MPSISGIPRSVPLTPQQKGIPVDYVPVTIADPEVIAGRLTKTSLREALRRDPAKIRFRVQSMFHGNGDIVTGKQACDRGWSLEVHDDQSRSVGIVLFNMEGRSPNHLQAVVR